MKYGIAAMFVLALVMTGVRADDKVGEISHDDLAKAVKDKKVVLIDCNGSATYKAGHIPGAVDGTQDKDALAKSLPKEKDALIVAYCGNENCGAYNAGAKKAKDLGYTNIKHYKPGLAGWKKSGEKLEKAEN